MALAPRPRDFVDDDWNDATFGALWRLWSGAALLLLTSIVSYYELVDKIKFGKPVKDFLSRNWEVRADLAVIFSGIFVLVVAAGAITLIRSLDRARKDEAGRKLLKLATDYVQTLGDLDKAKQETDKVSAENRTLNDIIVDQDRIMKTDPVTGIPNYKAWEDDVRRWSPRRASEKAHSLVLIDIDKLKWLNARSREGADQVLRLFARNTYESMRRDERVYKNAELKEGSEMYRHHQGGDEFFFVINDDVFAAVGFINRLAEKMPSYTSLCRSLLTPWMNEADIQSFELSFSAVITPLSYRDITPDVINPYYGVLDRAKESKSSRLFLMYDNVYETPMNIRSQLEAEVAARQDSLSAAAPSTERVKELELAIGAAERNIALLRRSEALFGPRGATVGLSGRTS